MHDMPRFMLEKYIICSYRVEHDPGRRNLVSFVEHQPRTRIEVRLICKDKKRPPDTM
jgi:hypothetical protein